MLSTQDLIVGAGLVVAVGVAVGVPIVSGTLVGKDAAKRGMSPWGWGLFVAFLFIIGLPMYLIMRRPIIDATASSGQIPIPTCERTKRCPFCAEIILDQAIKCKHCGSEMTQSSS